MKPDQALLLALKFVRMLAYGQTTIVLVPFLLKLGCTDSEVGIFMTATLIGDVILSSYITLKADLFGRRYMLGVSAVMMLLSGVVFVFSHNFYLLLLAAIFGVISPSGDEVGPFRAIEEATIAQITEPEDRARVFAGQNLVGMIGLAVGSITGGWLMDFFTERAGKVEDAYRIVFGSYVLCALLNFIISAALSEETEILQIAEEATEQERHDLDGYKKLALTLCLFFGIDSLAYGFMPNSWLVEYMMRTFHSSSTIVGMFFFVSTFISGLTSFPSAWFTNYVGPVAAISLTKLGAGFFGALVPTTHRESQAMGYVWLRSLFDTMDVVPRQVFLTSIIDESERTKILGMINVTKTLARAGGPVLTGMLAGAGMLAVSFYIMGFLEWAFAIAVYVVFRHSLDTSGPVQV